MVLAWIISSTLISFLSTSTNQQTLNDLDQTACSRHGTDGEKESWVVKGREVPVRSRVSRKPRNPGEEDIQISLYTFSLHDWLGLPPFLSAPFQIAFAQRKEEKEAAGRIRKTCGRERYSLVRTQDSRTYPSTPPDFFQRSNVSTDRRKLFFLCQEFSHSQFQVNSSDS